MKRSEPAGSRVAPRLVATRPQAPAQSFSAASQPPDGSYPSALNCCSDSCHNNQVAFVCTRHAALVYCFWKQWLYHMLRDFIVAQLKKRMIIFKYMFFQKQIVVVFHSEGELKWFVYPPVT